MKMIVGLGNPGKSYQQNRHNIGRRVIEKLAAQRSVVLKRDSGTYSKLGEVAGGNCIIAYPLVYMNLSGISVGLLVKKHRIAKEQLLVVCDDLDLELGHIRLRPKGTSAGHKGLESVINSLGTAEFARLRVGIGRPQGRGTVEDFVLSDFRKEEKTVIKEAVEKAEDCCAAWLAHGISEAMNKYN